MRFLLLSLLVLCLRAEAQLAITMNDNPSVTISPQDFAKLPRHTALRNEHGKNISYEGPSMHDVLVKGGVDFGTGLHGKQLSTYVLASASDGYEVVFALADFDPTITEADIIIADKRDGHALAAEEGSMRIIAPRDKRATRSLRLLQQITVFQLRK